MSSAIWPTFTNTIRVIILGSWSKDESQPAVILPLFEICAPLIRAPSHIFLDHPIFETPIRRESVIIYDAIFFATWFVVSSDYVMHDNHGNDNHRGTMMNAFHTYLVPDKAQQHKAR